ncbi:unnamed protein product [Clonostachys rosea]|uniref:Uncharacterized protein n=1 Tax=Bionectria ochroleuca TaxID=29856 RepID=A0ABY6V177_BIOOC|nr:unnamed protein product [Clonostachys rosea]
MKIPSSTNKKGNRFKWKNISLFFSSYSKEKVQDSSQNPSSAWSIPTLLSTSPEESQEPREGPQRQPSTRALSTIFTPLSESQLLIRINTNDHRMPEGQSSPEEEDAIQPRGVLEDPNPLGFMNFGPLHRSSDWALLSWNDRRSNLSDSWSDQTDVEVGEVKNLEKKGIKSAVQAFWTKHDLSRNPFLPRPKHLKPARVRFPLD